MQLRDFIFLNMHELHIELKGLPLSIVRRRLNEITGLNFKGYEDREKVSSEFLAVLKNKFPAGRADQNN